MAKVVTDQKYYTAIADTIRGKTGTATTYKPSEMPAGVGEVYDAGYADGKKAEYDAFWDVLQSNTSSGAAGIGKRVHYAYAFAFNGWTDKNYNPKYPITPTNSNGLGNMFNWNTGVTDTKVPITAFGSCVNAFSNNNIERIPKLIFSGTTNVNNMFQNCTKLEELYCEGELALSISFANSPLLSTESVQSIIDCLADLTGQTAQAVSFHTDVLAKLTDEQIAIILAKNWTF